MQTLRVDLILAAVVGAVFLIALGSGKLGWGKGSLTGFGSFRMAPGTFRMERLAKFFYLFWGWADYTPKDWSNAPYKRGYLPNKRGYPSNPS
jgi:hypothetical protein